MEKKITYIILIIVFFLLGFGFGRISEQGRWQEKLAQTQKEIDWWKSNLEMFYPPLPEEIYSFSGRVTEIGDNFLWMEAFVQVSQLPLPGGAETEKQNIKVNVTDKTKIFKIEVPEFPPLPEGEIPEIILSFGDIKVGDQISVNCKENIKGEKEIVAAKIQIISGGF